MDVHAQMLVFSRISRALTEVLGRDIRTNDPRTSAGYPARKLPLRADCSFLKRDLYFSHLWALRGGMSPKWGFGVEMLPVGMLGTRMFVDVRQAQRRVRHTCSGVSKIDYRNCAFWCLSKSVWTHLGWVSMRARVVFGRGS